MMKITVDGKIYESIDGDITINGGRVIVSGEDITDKLDINSEVIELVVHGSPKEINCDGSVKVYGNVLGDISSGGSIKCNDVQGDINAGGSVKSENVEGSINAGGSITIKGDYQK